MQVLLNLRRRKTLFLASYCGWNLRYVTSSGEDTVAGEKRLYKFDAHMRYRRRSSNPQTLREKEDFRRDTKYGRHRPIPDLPWLQLKRKTYLDDAERLYGPMEEWQRVDDEALREKLVAILQDYLRDIYSATRLEVKDARKYRRLCEISTREYRHHIVAGAFHSSNVLRDWAASLLARQRARNGSNSASNVVGDGDSRLEHAKVSSSNLPISNVLSSTTDSKPDLSSQSEGERDRTTVQREQELRRCRGEQANLEHTPAVMDLPESDLKKPSVSAFPFLRQRALEDEDSLDSSLVDWTAKYFPHDDKDTFKQLPKLRQDKSHAIAGASPLEIADQTHDGASNEDRSAQNVISDAANKDDQRVSRHHARHRLQRSLRSHEDRHHPTFDGEGVFFYVRDPSDKDEHVPKPRAVRSSDFMTRPATGAKVVKVPWNVVSSAKQQGYSYNILKAKERLARLSRGENPETMP